MNHDHAMPALIGAANAVLMAALGVDYYATVWAFLGSLFALTQMSKVGRLAAVLHVVVSTLGGAALGTGCASYFASGKPVLIVLSLVAGASAQTVLNLLVQLVSSRIKSMMPGGNP